MGNLHLIQFNLYLFDFDGLLVNTEMLHFEAYHSACSHYQLDLKWDFPTYCEYAHYGSTLLRENLQSQFLELRGTESWKNFYQLKTDIVTKRVQAGSVDLMPGVEVFLDSLLKNNKKICIVTHSKKEMTQPIIDQHPALQKIEHWITRYDYSAAKPSPECYQLALKRYLNEGEKAIGFEDTPRGLKALRGTDAQAVWVTSIPYKEITAWREEGVWHFNSFNSIVNFSGLADLFP